MIQLIVLKKTSDSTRTEEQNPIIFFFNLTRNRDSMVDNNFIYVNIILPEQLWQFVAALIATKEDDGVDMAFLDDNVREVFRVVSSRYNDIGAKEFFNG